ncbi:helix-turn-helix domain-containing protein [Burkholderia cenocepacia]|uniref:helix-turn-helix domain-containing protein n=1 Tax=Burkholderia cenocepacia TaxID=95486 RepID=UPI002862F0B5|nr:helix-turn-helix domain-containing protein [Burkholderia cenocepacia]MDR8077779.1 helix-turn-helix domain-containing protein [Burkholderia cenocepacia]
MEIRVIKSDDQYRTMLHEAERLVSLDPEPGSQEAEKLELLTVLIEDFEKKNFPFESPDPIEAIEFRMEQQGLRQVDLAPLLGSRSRVSEILSRKRPLTVQMIRSLSTGLGIPAEVLLAERPAATTSRPKETDMEWDKFPVREMAKRGWINVGASRGRIAKEAVEASVKAFLTQVSVGSASPALFRRTFRGDVLDDKSFYSTLAWTARVLARAKDQVHRGTRFNPAELDEAFFVKLARLSRRADGPRQAVTALAEKGVVLVVEPKLPNTLLDGAALLTESGVPVIGLTLRYDRIDYFWFTLLHELAHVWKHLHSADEAFIDRLESSSVEAVAEKEANRIARDSLIPRAIWSRSQAFLNPSRDEILKLAENLDIHPAIVVGRLQKENDRYEIFRDLLGQDTVRSLFSEVKFS